MIKFFCRNSKVRKNQVISRPSLMLFLKKIPCLLAGLILLTTYTSAEESSSYSLGGVSEHNPNMHQPPKHEKPQAPNTVKGVIRNGREGDFVLLRGYFVRVVDRGIYEFQDDDNSAIFVDLGKNYAINEQFFSTEFFIWGEVRLSGRNPVIRVNSIRANMMPKTVPPAEHRH